MANDSILIQVQLGSPTRANINAVTKQIQSALSNVSANVQIQNGRQAAQQLQTIKNKTDSASKSMNSFGEAIGLSARRFLAFTSAVAVVGRLTSAISQATREAIKFEREFVKLAQVFDTDVKALGSLQNSMSQLSKEFGLSANVIAKTSVVLAQSGLSARQTEQAMKALAKTTLAATFDSLAASTEGAVAIMAQFGTEASKLESQFGAINAVSKRFAVESGDIIEAVRRAGGAFKAAGGDLNDFIGLFTAVRSTTRESAETIATGFRTIFARIQRPKTIEFFRQLNIELTDGRGNFIGAFKAIRRLSEGLDQAGIKAGSLRFASVVEQLGGIRQVSRVIPLLQKFTKAEQARQVAEQGGASLDRDAAKAQQTLAQAFARTTENFRALIREISQTETFQAMVRIALDLANALIEVARSLKPLIPLLATLGAVKIGGLASGALKKGFGGAGGTGGLGRGFKRGGPVPGTGSGDTVPAMLEPGEFVIRKSAVQAFGADRLAGINKYSGGGIAVKASALGSAAARNRVIRIDAKESDFLKGRSINSEDSIKFTKKEFGINAPSAKGASPKDAAKFEVIAAQQTGRRRAKSKIAPLDLVGGAFPIEVRNRVETTTDAVLADKLFRYILETQGEKSLRNQIKNDSIGLGTVGIAYNTAKVKSNTKKLQSSRVARRAAGGSISGAGTDTVPALLTPGEFVVNKKSAETFGYGNLRKINKYNKGGVVGVQKFKGGGSVKGGGGMFGDEFIGKLFQMSFALSTVTALLDDTEGTLNPLTKSLATLAVVTVGAFMALKKIRGFRDDRIARSRATRGRIDAINRRRVERGKGALSKRGLRRLGGGLRLDPIQLAFTALAVTVGTVTAVMVAQSAALQKRVDSEVKKGRQLAAVQAQQIKNTNDINAGVVITFTALSAAAIALTGPLGLLVPIVLGLWYAAKGAEGVLASFSNVIFDVSKVLIDGFVGAVKSIVELINYVTSFVGLDPIDTSVFDEMGNALKSVAANIAAKVSPAMLGLKADVDTLSKAMEVASSNIIEESQKGTERGQKQFDIAGTPAQKGRVLGVNLEDLITRGQRFDDTGKDFKAGIDQINKTFDERVRKQAPGSELRAELERERKAKIEGLEAKRAEQLKDENEARLNNIAVVMEQARAVGQGNAAMLKLNEGIKVQRDINNVITQDSLQNGSELQRMFKALVASGLSEKDALIELTSKIDGTSNALAAFTANLSSRSKTLGEFLRKLTTGNIEDRIKAGRTVNQGAQAIRSGSLAQVPASQQSGVIDFIGSMFSLGAVSDQQARAIVNERVGAGQMADIEKAIRNRITSESPGSPQADIDQAVAEQMKIVVAGFFGQDPVAAANKIANEATAKNTEKAAEATQELKEEVAKANAGGFAAGGTVYANQGALVNFKPKGTDTVPAMLTPGEFVVRKSSVDKYGTGMMKSINAGTFSGGGIIEPEYLMYGSGGFQSAPSSSASAKRDFEKIIEDTKERTYRRSFTGSQTYAPAEENIEPGDDSLFTAESARKKYTSHPSYAPVQIRSVPSAAPFLTAQDEQLIEQAHQEHIATQNKLAAEGKLAAELDVLINRKDKSEKLISDYITSKYGPDGSSIKESEFLKGNRPDILDLFGKISDFKSAARLKRATEQKQAREAKRQEIIAAGRSDEGRFDSKGRLKRDPVAQDHKTIEQQINEMGSITEQNRKREAALSKRMRADSKIGPSDEEIAENAERAKRLRAAADASRAELEKEGISPLGTSKYDKSFDPTAALMTKEEHDKMFETMYAESDARKAQTEREISDRKAADRNRIKRFIIDDLNFINEYGNRNNRLNRLISKYGSVGNDLLNNDPEIINLRKKVFQKVMDQEGGRLEDGSRVRPKREKEALEERLRQPIQMESGRFMMNLSSLPGLWLRGLGGTQESLDRHSDFFYGSGISAARKIREISEKDKSRVGRISQFHAPSKFHSGGMIPGRAERPLYAQGGEFVMQRSAVNRIGAGNLHYMNNGGNVPANGTMNVMGGESLNDAAGKLENALSNHAIPETINVQLGNLSVDIGGNVLPGMETMVKEAIAEALMDYENTKDTDNSPGSYGRSVAQERFGNTT